MTRYESKHVAHVSMVVDIPINCCVRLLHLVPILPVTVFYKLMSFSHPSKSEVPDRWFSFFTAVSSHGMN